MKNYVNNFSNTADRNAGTEAFEAKGYVITGLQSASYIVIDTDAKTVQFTNHAEGTQLWSERAVMALLDTPEVEVVVETPKAYVVSAYAGNVNEMEALFALNGWTVSGNRAMPNINFNPDAKEITFASIAVGERLYTKADVLALLGEDYDIPATEVAEQDEIVDEIIEEILEEVPELDFNDEEAVEDVIISTPINFNEAPERYKTSAVAKTEAYALHVLTDGEAEISGDAEDFAVVIK